MKIIRDGVFETNSSSTHSLSIVTCEEFNSFKKGDLIWDDWEVKLISKQEGMNQIAEIISDKEHPDVDHAFDECKLYTYERMLNMTGYEYFEQNYTTKRGEKLVAFGYYGRD